MVQCPHFQHKKGFELGPPKKNWQALSHSTFVGCCPERTTRRWPANLSTPAQQPAPASRSSCATGIFPAVIPPTTGWQDLSPAVERLSGGEGRHKDQPFPRIDLGCRGCDGLSSASACTCTQPQRIFLSYILLSERELVSLRRQR